MAAEPADVRRQRVERGRAAGRGRRRGRLAALGDGVPGRGAENTDAEDHEREEASPHHEPSMTPHPMTAPAAPSGDAASSRPARTTTARPTSDMVPSNERTGSMRS